MRTTPDRVKSISGSQGLRLMRWLSVMSIVWTMLAIPAPAFAQMVPGAEQATSEVSLPENLTQEEIRELIARMSDDQVRELMISQLDKSAIEEQPDDAATYVGQLATGMQVAGDSLLRMFASGDSLYALPESIWQQVSDHGKVSGWQLLFQLFGLILVGSLVERLVKQRLSKIDSNVADATSIAQRAGRVSFRAAVGLVEIVAFVAGAILFLTIVASEMDNAMMLWRQIIWFIVYVKIALLGVHLIVAPGKPAYRLVPVEDDVARSIWGWTLAITIALTLPVPEVVRDFGADQATSLLVGLVFSAAFIALLVALVIRLRRYGAGLIAGAEAKPGSIRGGLARIWWILAILYILLVWFLAIGRRAATGESSMVPGIGSLVLFSAIPYIDMGLRWLVVHYFEKEDSETRATDASTTTDSAASAPAEDSPGEVNETSAASALAEDSPSEVIEMPTADTEPQPLTAVTEPGYVAVALRYARVLLGLAVLVIFVRLWDIDLEAITAQLVSERFASALFDISLTVLLTWAVWGVIRISIERKLGVEGGQADAGAGESEAGGLGGTRIETVLPLIRVFIQITLIVMAVMLSLSALGVDIGPLIAGAGVIGIAVGFGAQTLVRDIVSGLFFLLDDAFRVGEYVDIEGTKGTVEHISVRSFQLRHHNGPVHTIPYGEIKHLTNYSRDWAIMKFEIRVPFETDIEVVRKIIKRVGIEMLDDPVYGMNMLEPLKSQGVNRMDDSALIIRCKFTAVPGQQFLIRREAFTCIQRAFEESGIHFAPRRVLVESVKPLTTAEAGAAGAMDSEAKGKAPPADDR